MARAFDYGSKGSRFDSWVDRDLAKHHGNEMALFPLFISFQVKNARCGSLERAKLLFSKRHDLGILWEAVEVRLR
jgi:hypothetical protein